MSDELPEIDVDALVGHHAAGKPVLDVRQPDEYVEGHVPGAALIPLADIPDRAGEVPAEGTVYVVCKSGGRSRRATEFLRGQGVDAVNVSGGTMAWIESGQPVVTGDRPG